MRNGVGFSILFHMLVVAIGYIALPALSSKMATETPIMVEVVMASDTTNAPTVQIKPKPKKKVAKPKPKPKPKAEPKAEPKQTPPHQAKVETPPPPSPPIPPAKPQPVVAAVSQLPEPKPKAKLAPKPKPKPKPEAKPKRAERPLASRVLAQARPRKKPKPPKPVNAFASVLKTVAQLKAQPVADKKSPAVEKKKKKKKTKESFDQLIAKALVYKKKRAFDASRPLSISEIDLVRRQIGQCWILPAGAKGAENINIEISVDMNFDGTVRAARINNKGLQSDKFLRAMAEGALHAVLNRRCQPFKLPRDKYDRWKTMTLIFNPKEMFGG